jgi:hypothetical protein
MDKETIIDKCRKLMALANDRGATPAEAQAAMGLAAKLLAKHSLSMADIATGSYGEPFAEESVVVPYIRAPRWVVHLALAICAPLDCRALCMNLLPGHPRNPSRRTMSEIHFLGRKSDAMVAAYMFDWLHALLPRAAKGQTPPGGPTNRAIVVARIKTDGLERFFKDRYPGITDRVVKGPKEIDMDGVMAGFRYGRRLPLKKGLGVAQEVCGESQTFSHRADRAPGGGSGRVRRASRPEAPGLLDGRGGHHGGGDILMPSLFDKLRLWFHERILGHEIRFTWDSRDQWPHLCWCATCRKAIWDFWKGNGRR